MYRYLNKLAVNKHMRVAQAFLLMFVVLMAVSSAAHAQSIEGEITDVADTFRNILTGPIAMIIGGVLVVVAVMQLIQRNWSSGVALLLAAILLMKLGTIMEMFRV